MSADLLTRPLAIERFGLVYASAQKNLGAAGLTIIIVREDLLGKARPGTPAPFDYSRQAKERSKVNTPATFAVAVAFRMLRWLIEAGGLAAAEERSRRKSSKLYALIGSDSFYSSPVATDDRSRVSVRFHLPTPALEKRFLEAAAASGILYLGGHPSVGGLRANLYNGVPETAVDTLVEFMGEFQRRRG
jgi:phosphoserine aminotransferase